MFSASTSMGRWPTAWTASVWKGTPLLRQAAPISATGWMVPISLLANMMDTRAVSLVMAFSTSATETRPSRSTGR